MSPRITVNHRIDSHWGESKQFCHSIDFDSILMECAYGFSQFVSKFSSMMGFSMLKQKMFFGMHFIIRGSTPFEILNAIIGRITINMIYLRKIIGIGDESQCDKSMYKKFRRFFIFIKHYSKSSIYNPRFKETAISFFSVTPTSLMRPNLTILRRCIESFIPWYIFHPKSLTVLT